MSAELLRALDQAGVMLWWDGQALRYRAPCEALTPELREAMREHRGALIVAAQARGGVLVPEHQGAWPRALREAFRARLEELASDGRIGEAEAARRAARGAAVAWLREQVGVGESDGLG